MTHLFAEIESLFSFSVAGSSDLARTQVPGTETSGSVSGLRPASSYRFRVMAENALGVSEPSQFITANTDEEGTQETKLSHLRLNTFCKYFMCDSFLCISVPGGPPLDVEVQPTGSQSLKVTWKVNYLLHKFFI